jgi:hypothetical protein
MYYPFMGTRVTDLLGARTTRAAQLFFALILAGCEPGGGAGVVSGLTGVEGDPTANPWLGLYEGAGRGSLAGAEVMPEGVMLLIWPDADSVRVDTCARCFTVRLDTLFTLANVSPGSTVSLDLQYSDNGVQRSLRLDRYSGRGGIGNVVAATLALSGDVSGAVEYVLERR